MELKIERENVIVPIVSALLIVIISNLKIDWYFKTIMFPFFMVLVSSTILVMKNDDINKKAFYLLIPIILIIFSNLILILLKGTLDENNEIIGYEFVNLGRMMDMVKAGKDANEAIKEATGTYGRFDDAAKYIDPRKE